MKHKTVLIAAVVLFALLPVPIGAQETTTATPAAPDGAPSDVELVVDESTAIVEWRHVDGEMVIEVYSEEHATMTVAAESGRSGSQSSFRIDVVALSKDRTTTVRMPTSGAVSVWTDASIEDGRAYRLKKPGGLLPQGPYSGTDVRNAGVAGAAGVALVVLFEAAKAKIGARDRGERVA